MIGIKLDGDDEFLELDPDTSIALKLENPLLGDGDKISPGSYSYPFEVPGGASSPRNAAKLKNPHVLENNEAYSLQNATLHYAGLPFKKGTLKGKSSSGNRIPSNFLFGLSQVSPDFKTARLRDVIAENIIIDDSPITKNIYVKKTGGGDWSVSVNGKNYTGADANALAGAINADFGPTLDTGKYVPRAAFVNVGTSPSGDLAAPYVQVYLSLYYTYFDPVLEIEFLLEQVSTDPLHELHVTTDEPEDYLVESFDMDDYYTGFETFLAGYLSGAYPTDKIRFPLTFNANPYGTTEKIKESEVINAVDADGLIRNDANWGLNNDAPFQVKNYNSLQPFVRLKWLLEKIGEVFGFELEGDFYALADVADMTIHNTASLDVIQNYIGNKKFVFWKRSFNMSELVPDISVVDFFAALQSRYNFAVYYSDQTLKVRMELREPIAKSQEYTDITAISSNVRNIEDQRLTGFTIRCPREENDALSLEEKVTVGISEKEYLVKCGSIRSTGVAVIGGQAMTGPRVSQKIGDKFGLRIFYYKGIIEGPEFDYAKAGIDGEEIFESIPDFFVEGIYSTFWKYWLHFEMNRRAVKIDVNLMARQLRHFLWSKKNRFDRLNFIVKSIDVRLKSTGPEVSELELFTMS